MCSPHPRGWSWRCNTPPTCVAPPPARPERKRAPRARGCFVVVPSRQYAHTEYEGSDALLPCGRLAPVKPQAGFSKSSRALAAEGDGKLVASRLARILGVRTSVLRRHLRPCEWHHTSAWLNRTEYYWEPLLVALATDPDATPVGHAPEDVERMRVLLDLMRSESCATESLSLSGQRVTWTQWNPVDRSARRREASGCRVDIAGEWATITLGDGTSVRKRVGSRDLSWRPDEPFDLAAVNIEAMIDGARQSGAQVVARFRRPQGRAKVLRLEIDPAGGYPVSLYREAGGRRRQLLHVAAGPSELPHLVRLLDGWVIADDEPVDGA